MNRTIQSHVLPDAFEQTQCILIVDDEHRMRSSLRQLLDGHDREIMECGTGTSAIAALKAHDIDLVLLDIGLPDISGLEVMEWIKNNKIPTSVIFVSADDRIDAAIRALRNGAVEFVRKPSELEEIQHKVENALYRRRLERSHALMNTRIEHSEQLHRFLVENSPDLIYTLDLSGCFTFINNRVESLLGNSRDEIIGLPYSSIVYTSDLDKARYAFTERRIDKRATANLEVRLKCRHDNGHHFDSNYIIAMLSATGIYETRGGDGTTAKGFSGTYGVARDITERKIAEETISFQAFHDQLTHLPNQRLFSDRLEMAITHAKRSGRVVGVMFIDLDRFKLVNDTYGHAEGDELLKSVAHRLHHCMRAGDTLARKGGDEFTVLLPDLSSVEDTTVIAEKIANVLDVPFLVSGQEFHVTASIGISVFPRDGDTVDVLLKNADIAMYKVKANGKNGAMFFTPDMNSCNHERIRLENDLRQAVNNSELRLYYQPQVSIGSSQIIAMEALVRWQHPVHGLMGPSNFIDMAEEAGLIGPITDWVLAESCRQLAQWHAQGFDKLRIAVNVSPQEFDRCDMVDRIAAHVNAHNLPAESLDIEITENIFLQGATSVINKMRALRDKGIRISIDDFGTCYSSLNYLRLFPINAIKIDQSFVNDLDASHRVFPIVQAIINLAGGFGLNLVAEGVETDFQLKTLHDLGCDEMQGYLFSRPVPAADAEQLLRNAYTDPLPAALFPLG